MAKADLKSKTEQVAAWLRTEVMRGSWVGEMPGRHELAAEIGINSKTVECALQLLVREGLLLSQGPGRKRKIVRPDKSATPALRVRILLYEASDAHDEHMVALRHRLEEQGYNVAIAAKTLADLRFDVDRVARVVEKAGGDAWIVRSGPRAVLEWFAARSVPAFAMFGRQSGIPMASLATLKSPAVAEALRRLVDFGHSRIVMLAREERRKPTPGLMERRYLEELERLGIEVGSYNLPDWKNDRQSFHRCLDSLFQHTPPTALLIGEPALFFATQQYLVGKGIIVPSDVSLIALDDHPAFEWFEPEVSHIRTDTRRWVRRMVEWADNVARDRKDFRETLIRSEFIGGGTIAPARAR